jgi:peptidoglycan-associated lipoprotein
VKLAIPLFVLTAALIVQGCSPKQVSAPLSERVRASSGQTGVQGSSGAGTETQRGRTSGITEEDLLAGSKDQKARDAAQSDANQLASHLQDIYFDFDSYGIRTEDLGTLKGIAAWLNGKPGVRITIEGYCDERGTIDYNLALGQKRAEAAKEYLVKMGASEKQLKTLSYGKEAPLDQGHTEQAWQKNRRAHFVAR